MLRISIKLFLFGVSAVVLLAVSGYQQRVNVRSGFAMRDAGSIQMGRRVPPVHAVKAKPSVFDWVRYALEGGPYFDASKMSSSSLTEGMNDMQKLQYRADVDHRGQEATLERVEDLMRGHVGEPLIPRGIQLKSATGQ